MKDSITLYSSPTCPVCRCLKMKLDEHNIEYNETHDTEPLVERHILKLPVLEVNGNFMLAPEAIKWINSLK